MNLLDDLIGGEVVKSSTKKVDVQCDADILMDLMGEGCSITKGGAGLINDLLRDGRSQNSNITKSPSIDLLGKDNPSLAQPNI